MGDSNFSFQINDVFLVRKPDARLSGTVRLIAYRAFHRVVLINTEWESAAGPFRLDYERWVELLDDEAIEEVVDPYINLTSIPSGLPEGAMSRIKKFTVAMHEVAKTEPDFLLSRQATSRAVAATAKRLGTGERTVKRWVIRWLKAGSNPTGVVHAFVERLTTETFVAQARGKKRGVAAAKPELVSDAPAHEVAENIVFAYKNYISMRGMTWEDAFYEMLIVQYRIPKEAIKSNDSPEMLLTPALIEKFRPATWYQFRYRVRLLERAKRTSDNELPRGKRGKATDNVPGPGFFEIDATFFQIQLVSRLTQSKLVGRPTVYLIVDIFSDAIVGYAVTLENPSWAVAALALYNTFSNKEPIFSRLGLPYSSKDWPCEQLPTVLRADRAELVSNMGHEFPSSGIRVNIPPPMTPEGKGTIEGKNSELKNKTKNDKGRFNLPGLYAKHRKRRESDGKKQAALNLFDFERILVEIIVDLNMRPVNPSRIPRDAFAVGGRVASRIGLYEWALSHRPGFTRAMSPNFLYEHLLTKGIGSVTPAGIRFDGETFVCDRLRDMGFLVSALNDVFKISVAYNPIYAGEVFFFDQENSRWVSAVNTDPGILRVRASFAEARESRALGKKLTDQAKLVHQAHARERAPFVKQIINTAKANKSQLPLQPLRSLHKIRENRAEEKAANRAPMDALVATSAQSNSTPAAFLAMPLGDPAPEVTQQSDALDRASKFKLLWSRVNARN